MTFRGKLDGSLGGISLISLLLSIGSLKNFHVNIYIYIYIFYFLVAESHSDVDNPAKAVRRVSIIV